MPGQLAFRLVGDRPLISVEVKPSIQRQDYLTRGSIPIPSETVHFLIDTGAPYCVIDESVVSNWPLRRHTLGTAQRTGRTFSQQTYQYDLSLRLHTHSGSDSWLHGAESVQTVSPGHFKPDTFKGIIGMSILLKGRLSLDGHTGVMTLDW
jgi:hypothetical protein